MKSTVLRYFIVLYSFRNPSFHQTISSVFCVLFIRSQVIEKKKFPAYLICCSLTIMILIFTQIIQPRLRLFFFLRDKLTFLLLDTALYFIYSYTNLTVWHLFSYNHCPCILITCFVILLYIHLYITIWILISYCNE